ncbi:MAG: glycosyltransferase family 2 protein [Candidatus Rokubacteria bacterium]|nr:glycosyltransferase family 2 protein [Candidatus Rokubacteria bacterium]
MRCALSVVVPAFNEAGKIAGTIRQIADYLGERKLAGEILVVDDGSRDATAVEAAAAPHGDVPLRVIRNPRNEGKGAAVRRGVLAARGDRVLFTDVDLSVPLGEFDRFAAALDDGADIVIGSRRLGGSPLRRWFRGLGVSYQSRIKVHQPFYREILGEAYQKLTLMLLGLDIRDANCGFKGFRGDVARRVFEKVTVPQWGFDAEVLVIAKRHGFRVAELEVEWHNDASSRVNLLSAPFSSLAELVRVKRNDRRRRYAP